MLLGLVQLLQAFDAAGLGMNFGGLSCQGPSHVDEWSRRQMVHHEEEAWRLMRMFEDNLEIDLGSP